MSAGAVGQASPPAGCRGFQPRVCLSLSIITLTAGKDARVEGQASCLPVAAASGREFLSVGVIILPETSGRMPEEPAGWKPALHHLRREHSPFGLAQNVGGFAEN